MSALQHREAGPPATAELFSDLLSNITQCASGAACSPRQQRSIQHFSATPWLNVIAPAVWAPQPVAALHSSSKFKQQQRRRLLVSMRCTAHGCMGNTRVADVRSGMGSSTCPASVLPQCYRDVHQHLQPSERLRNACAARHFCSFLLANTCRPHVPKGAERLPEWFSRHRLHHADARAGVIQEFRKHERTGQAA
jgi:hypothetical protein